MKKIAIVATTLLTAVASYGQGTVNFANAGATFNAPVHVDTITGANAGTTYMAQLLLVQGTSLTAVGSAATFVAPGYFNGGVVTVSQVAPGAQGTFEVFAWDSTGGNSSYATGLSAYTAGSIHGGYSNPVTITTGGVGSPATPPSPLDGLQTWAVTIVPEPSTIALGVLGIGALLLRRRK